MSRKLFEFSPEERAMILEVVQNTRNQKYTPETLCEIQSILDTQYYYYWCNDLKKEERLMKDYFEEDFTSYWPGIGYYKNPPLNWCRDGKYINSFMNTAHMAHNPMIWLQDETHARGVFFFESNMTYPDREELLEHFFVYCHDFVKHENGKWYLSVYRLIGTKQYGEPKEGTINAPEGYEFPDWED